MSSLYVRKWVYVTGSVAGWVVYAVLRMLFTLPRRVLVMKLAALAAIVKALSGEGPTYHALDDINFILGRGGEAATTLERLITESRANDLVSMVRGTVIRSLS